MDEHLTLKDMLSTALAHYPGPLTDAQKAGDADMLTVAEPVGAWYERPLVTEDQARQAAYHQRWQTIYERMRAQ